jgi:hypothetical protein
MNFTHMFSAGENNSLFYMGLRMFVSPKTICWNKNCWE